MIGVFVSFTFAEFDARSVRRIAREARAKFTSLPGLRSKAFTFDEPHRRVINFYIWNDEHSARSFFSKDFVERAANIYGAPPTITFVEVAELVDNATSR